MAYCQNNIEHTGSYHIKGGYRACGADGAACVKLHSGFHIGATSIDKEAVAKVEVIETVDAVRQNSLNLINIDLRVFESLSHCFVDHLCVVDLRPPGSLCRPTYTYYRHSIGHIFNTSD
jgi:hypothetical protein